MPDPDTTKLLHHAHAEGWSLHRLASALGVSRLAACRLAVEVGVTITRSPRGAPRRHAADIGQRLYELVKEGLSLAAAARQIGIPEATAKRLAPEYALSAGLPWPVGPPAGERCYRAYERLRSWDAVAAEVLPESRSIRPGTMAMKLAKRWAGGTGDAPRAAWPVTPKGGHYSALTFVAAVE